MKLHSQVDLITNSSTEIFIVSETTMNEVRNAIDKVYRPCEDCPFKSEYSSEDCDGLEVRKLQSEEYEQISDWEEGAEVEPSDYIIRVRDWYTDSYEVIQNLERYFGDRVKLRERW